MTPVEFRRHLHSYPELSFEEHQTAAFIEQALSAEGIAYRRVAKTGVLAYIDGVRQSNRAILLRADIDALPVCEATQVDFASKNSGVMHACGHDMHAAVLFGALQQLNRNRDFEGRIFAIFQPGEECNPGGASLVLNEKPFENYDIRAVVGEHVDSSLEVGAIGVKAGKFMASSDELRFWVRGKGGHAALRQKVCDTITAAATLVVNLNGLNSEDLILSIGRIVGEGATNVIPDCVAMEGTMRTFDEKVRQTTKQQIADIAHTIDERFATNTEVDINHGYPSVVNSAELCGVLQEVAADAEVAVVELERRPMAEDFGYYCEQYPSLFYRLGVGHSAGMSHTSHFMPDESAIEIGIDVMSRLALRLMR